MQSLEIMVKYQDVDTVIDDIRQMKALQYQV